jgi:hypothetical protein
MMSCINKGRVARLVAGIALGAVVVLGIASSPAQANWGDRDWHHGGGWHAGWSGGYYGAPPVVYGDPYAYGYYPPPGVGINVGGVGIGIR